MDFFKKKKKKKAEAHFGLGLLDPFKSFIMRVKILNLVEIHLHTCLSPVIILKLPFTKEFNYQY